mmetsp:Transcript_11702/g.19881  ORF Transcript_11702/g.19881 Transcript_11702/m.19881 type:complete len:203 (+) Transcript_11702:109-717(+)
MAELDLGADWVDLSVDDLSMIGQFLLEGDEGRSTLDPSVFDEIEEEDEEDEGQVIQIDESGIGNDMPETSRDTTTTAWTAEIQAKLAEVTAENVSLKQVLTDCRKAHEAAAKTAALAAEREGQRLDAERNASESRQAVTKASEAAQRAEAALEEARTRAEAETSQAAVEVERSGSRAVAAEALAAALRLELGIWGRRSLRTD